MQFQALPVVGDPDRYLVTRAGRVIGRFALRGFQAHGAAARLPGPHGVIHDLVIEGGRIEAELVLAAIAHRSLARLYGSVFFTAGDHAVLRTLGIDNATNLPNVIGVFEPGRAENLARFAA